MATKSVPYDYIVIDQPRYISTVEAYFKWKDLNSYLKNISNRGLNMPDAISEPLGCWALSFVWNRGSTGDATDTVDHNGVGNLKIEFKASSNFDNDLTSFGPETNFDKLYFLRFALSHNLLFIYDLGLTGTTLGNIRVNSRELVRDQQADGKRPRLRIIEDYIIPRRLAPVAVLNLVSHKKITGLTFDQAEYYGIHGTLPPASH